MSYLRLNYIGKSSQRLVIKENEKKEPDYIMKYQYQSKIRQKPSSTPPGPGAKEEGNEKIPCDLPVCRRRSKRGTEEGLEPYGTGRFST
jgi:hypothetical protein